MGKPKDAMDEIIQQALREEEAAKKEKKQAKQKEGPWGKGPMRCMAVCQAGLGNQCNQLTI